MGWQRRQLPCPYPHTCTPVDAFQEADELEAAGRIEEADMLCHSRIQQQLAKVGCMGSACDAVLAGCPHPPAAGQSGLHGQCM
eukprot:1144322-Pelagomonas_calceolata.AAC.2